MIVDPRSHRHSDSLLLPIGRKFQKLVNLHNTQLGDAMITCRVSGLSRRLTTLRLISIPHLSSIEAMPLLLTGTSKFTFRRGSLLLRTMSTNTAPSLAQADLDSFSAHLNSSSRILALCGAGLSAASGLPTFRGAGGYWREYDAMDLATPEAFSRDPSLVWQFYNYRRHMALQAQPNRAHLALAELARKKEDFLTISQNVDGLSPRAGHPRKSLELLHGSLFEVKCTNFYCDHVDKENYTDPICPALKLAESGEDISSAEEPLKDVEIEDLPQCPKCKTSLLRPGVVWFGESLPASTLERVDNWMSDERGIDLLIVIGTSAQVYPAAGYIMSSRTKGARVAVVNTETPDQEAGKLQKGDWFFQGDAAVVIPKMLECVTGPM